MNIYLKQSNKLPKSKFRFEWGCCNHRVYTLAPTASHLETNLRLDTFRHNDGTAVLHWIHFARIYVDMWLSSSRFRKLVTSPTRPDNTFVEAVMCGVILSYGNLLQNRALQTPNYGLEDFSCMNLRKYSIDDDLINWSCSFRNGQLHYGSTGSGVYINGVERTHPRALGHVNGSS
jgi:hypothetical protein